LYSDYVRADHPRRGVRGGIRFAGAQRPAAAAPPSFQRTELRDGLAQPLLSMHRSGRSTLRQYRDAQVPGGPGADVGVGSAILVITLLGMRGGFAAPHPQHWDVKEVDRDAQ